MSSNIQEKDTVEQFVEEQVVERNEQYRHFSDFELSGSIVRGLAEMGYESPTPVQSMTIGPALEKRDLIVLSRTGSGKTASFGIPSVQLIRNGGAKRCLVLSPTRELAVQVEAEISKIGKYEKIKSVVVYGKHSMNVEFAKFEKGFDILVGTPGRVLDHMEQGSFDPAEFDIVVLDEADRMLDMGFISQVDKIIGRTSKQRTTYLFSATIPDEIKALSIKYLNDPVIIELSSDVKTVEEVTQYHYLVAKNEKRTRLYDVLRHYNPASCIVFCNTRFEVDRVTDFLCGRGITAKSIHGANSQTLRLKFLNQFKNGEFRVLVATDVAARGLHIEDLELVINYNLPIEKDSYIHRIGRTGRAGKRGLALSFVSDGELFQLYTIEEHAGVMIEELPLPESSQSIGKANKKRGSKSGESNNVYGVGFREIDDYDPGRPREGKAIIVADEQKANGDSKRAAGQGAGKKKGRKKRVGDSARFEGMVYNGKQADGAKFSARGGAMRAEKAEREFVDSSMSKSAKNFAEDTKVIAAAGVAAPKKEGIIKKVLRIFKRKEKK